MKVVVANKFYRPVGGPETIVFDTMRELEALGHTAIPFAMAHPDNVASDYSDYFVPNIDYSEGRSGKLSRIKEAADIIYSREAKRRMEKLITDTKPDIAHAHNIYHQMSPSILVALRKAGIPTLLTLHDSKLLCANMLLLRRGEVCERCAGRRFHHAIINKCVKDSLAASAVCAVEETLHRWTRIYERNVDVIISPSEFLKNRMVDHGRLPADKVLVLPNYADTNSIYPDYTPGDYGLFIGKVESIKGIWTLLEACRQIPDFEIRFAGRGDILEDAVRYCETEGITNAKFLGFQTGEDLARLRRESRFVVVPSEWYENCPMVILEAFAAGKPVIASRMGGVPELIDQSADGLMFDAGDSDSLAGHMRTLIGDAQLASEMGRKGRQKVEGRYSMSAYMDSLLAIYHDLAPNK